MDGLGTAVVKQSHTIGGEKEGEEVGFKTTRCLLFPLEQSSFAMKSFVFCVSLRHDADLVWFGHR